MSPWLDALIQALPDRVHTDAATLTAHAADKWFASQEPEAVVLASNTEEVSRAMRIAHEHRVPVTTRGGGVGYVGGCVPVKGGLVIALAGMNRILEINPQDGVVVVQPGVITGDLQDAVRKLGWYYPPDPASLRECSLGGNVATNAGGPRCLKYGVTRPYVLGLEVVLANGDILRTGGRCHKNRQGFDLTGVFVGSEGMLGIITEITLRIIPHPPTRALLGATFRTFPEAAAAVQKILGNGHLPSALEITDKFTLQAARNFLGEERTPHGDAHLFVETDGHAEAVGAEAKKLTALLRGAGAIGIKTATTEQEVENLWSLRREFSYSLRATGLTKLNEDVVVPRSRLVDLVQFAESLQAQCGFPIACFGHAGDGNIHVNIMVPDMEDPVQRERAEGALDRLFHHVLSLGGVISGEHGIGLAKKRWFPGAVGEVAVRTHAALKAALDPLGLLNPGKFLD
ncbi:MAG: FAD-binding protein [Verrucomicrobiaceae bacterium]|nr:MAG: FAD-binding protein [Verrucomicrobiaceae bacterium]